MSNDEKLLDLESLLRILSGTIVTVAVGYLLIGQRAFRLPFMESPYLSIGIFGSLVYVVYVAWGWARALGITVLLSIVNAGLALRLFWTVWPQTLAMLSMIVLTLYYLHAWKIDKPLFGRLILMGAPFGIASGLLTLIFRLFLHPEYAFTAAKNNMIHGLQMGVALGLGLELAELAIRYWRQKHAMPKTA